MNSNYFFKNAFSKAKSQSRGFFTQNKASSQFQNAAFNFNLKFAQRTLYQYHLYEREIYIYYCIESVLLGQVALGHW